MHGCGFISPHQKGLLGKVESNVNLQDHKDVGLGYLEKKTFLEGLVGDRNLPKSPEAKSQLLGDKLPLTSKAEGSRKMLFSMKTTVLSIIRIFGLSFPGRSAQYGNMATHNSLIPIIPINYGLDVVKPGKAQTQIFFVLSRTRTTTTISTMSTW